MQLAPNDSTKCGISVGSKQFSESPLLSDKDRSIFNVVAKLETWN